MTFTFSIRTALHKSWDLFIKHIWFFAGLAFVMMIFSIFSNQHHDKTLMDGILTVIVLIATVLWSYVWISAALAAVDGKEDLVNYRSLSAHMPNIRQFFMLVGVGLLTGLIVAAGFVLLIIPGIYFVVRLAFANTAYVDRQMGVWKSLKYSWELVRGKIFWTVFLVLIINIAFIILGAIPFMLGLFITYPLGMLMMTYLYRDLTVYHRQMKDIELDGPVATEV